MDNLLPLLLERVGPEPLEKSAQRELARLRNARSPALERFLQELVLMDMALLARAVRSFKRDRPKLARRLLSAACRVEPSEARRRALRRIAVAAELDSAVPALPDTNDGLIFTQSQSRALQKLEALARIYFGQVSRQAAIELRLLPLVLGPSGVGKTRLISELSTRLNVPLLRFSVSDWVVTGARVEPSTMQVIQAKLEDYADGFILQIDELDKLSSPEPWQQSVRLDIFSLADRRVGFTGTAKAPWTEFHSEALRKRVFMIGTGTWHEIWMNPTRTHLGFTQLGAGSEERALEDAIRSAKSIPPELLNRFSPWVPLGPYSREDFVLLADRLQLPDTFDPDEAVRSHLNYRYLEGFVTNTLLASALALQDSLQATTNKAP